jgi:hypothetical protein
MLKSLCAKGIAVLLACFFWFPALSYDLSLISRSSDAAVYLGFAGLLVLIAFAGFVFYFAYLIVKTYLTVKKEKV